MTNRAHDRRDPQKGKKGFSNKGFTVIELMIAVAVLAIIMSLALPSYRSIIEKRQVTSAAEQLSAFLSSVQIEAVKRSENITVSYSRTDEDTWCIGIVSGTTACDCTDTEPVTADCKIDDQVRVINGDSLVYSKVMQGMTGDGSFIFDPARGIVYDDSGFADYDAAQLELVSDNDTYAMNVLINEIGRVSMCSAGTDKQVPGYDLCQLPD